jgi:Ca-activated chloride channel family protein
VISRRPLLLATTLAVVALLAGCGSREQPPAAGAQSRAFSILAGSELKDLEPAMREAAQRAGVALNVSYGGTLDIVDRVNAGESFDAILPPNGAYPALALVSKPLAREKLFYSRVALGVKSAKLRELGWDVQAPSWADIAKAAGSGRLRYAMTNPVSSNTGMSALFAVASAVAGKTEDLSAAEVDAKTLTAFLSGQKLTAGSSGWLAEAYVKNPAPLDAMVNYEAVILRSNERLSAADQLRIVYPKDGVISADYPLMLLNGAKRGDYDKLVAAFKAPGFQKQSAAAAFLRPVSPDVPLAQGLSATAVAELTFPNNLDVIDSVLSAYQGDWRRPATSIFVLDISGSMKGERLDAMKAALKVLAGADARAASARYARFQKREHVVLLPFSSRTYDPVQIRFDEQAIGASRAQVIAFADALEARGGTGIYDALLQAEAMATRERAADAERYVSIVLLTDGENTSGVDLGAFRSQLPQDVPARIFPILFGEADTDDMNEVAALSGGRVFDGRKASLSTVFKEIRGYQ